MSLMSKLATSLEQACFVTLSRNRPLVAAGRLFPGYLRGNSFFDDEEAQAMRELFPIAVSWNHPCLCDASPVNAYHRMDDFPKWTTYQKTSRRSSEGVNDPGSTNSRKPYPRVSIGQQSLSRGWSGLTSQAIETLFLSNVS